MSKAIVPGERERVASVLAATGSLHQTLLQLVALGLTTERKWDRAESRHGTPSLVQVTTFDAFTATEVQSFTDGASGLLRDYAAAIPLAKHGSFWLPVWQGVLGAFIYSLLLIVVAILARLGGHDLIDILRDALKPGG